MFLQRKFARNGADAASAEPALCPGLLDVDWSALPEVIHDVVCNLQLLLLARRRYDHVLSDFGLSAESGQSGHAARVECLQQEVPETFARDERRFELTELDFEVDLSGSVSMKAAGRVALAAGVLELHFGVVGRKITKLCFVPDVRK